MTAGKGDRQRPMNRQRWYDGYERAFKMVQQDGKTEPDKLKTTPREYCPYCRKGIDFWTGPDESPCRCQPEFQGFQKIARFNRNMIITEKIDGTNAQVLITEDGKIFSGSRKRYLTPGNDNFGFAAWVIEHREELLQLGPGRHFGEWYGRGIQRNYGLNCRRFSLFNVGRWRKEGYTGCGPEVLFPNPDPTKEDKKRTEVPACCSVVPIICRGPFSPDNVRMALDVLLAEGSAAVPGFENPEGIVIYHTAANCLFKITYENDDPQIRKKPSIKQLTTNILPAPVQSGA